MTPFQLACFISVESHLSFTKAAEDCHVAQATISRQITMLEEELGCKLFDRDSHGVQPTSAGATPLPPASPRGQRWRRGRSSAMWG